MLSKYKHISFDLDGTLVHTIPEYRHKIVPIVMEQLGVDVIDKFAIDRFWFESGRDEIIKNNFNTDPEKFWNLFRKIDSTKERSAHTKAYDDAEITLRQLKEMGKIISIITGAPRHIAKMEIEKLSGAPHDVHLSISDNGFKGKPNPESFSYVLEKLSIKPNETLYIGNSSEDAYYAKNAGIDFVYIDRKEYKFDLKNHSTATIYSLNELFELKL